MFTFLFIYVKMLSYQNHFKEQYMGTIEKELVDKEYPGLVVPLGSSGTYATCYENRPCDLTYPYRVLY